MALEASTQIQTRRSTMKYVFAILFFVSIAFSQDTAKVANVPLKFKADTTWMSFIVYRVDGFLKADSGYLIRSGMGSEALNGFYADVNQVKVEVFLSNKKRVRVEDIWDLRQRGK
jgi:hypothetical protein